VINIITRSHESRFLVSREFDKQLKVEVEKFAASFPNAIPIIVLRRHDSYIASQYRRFVKNGFTGSFKQFFDLDSDTGYFKKNDLNYSCMLSVLEKNFNQKPLVFIYEDMRENPTAFIQKLANSIGAPINMASIDFSKKHSSYSERQLKSMLVLGRYVNMNKRRVFKNPILHFGWKILTGGFRYRVLYVARLMPKYWLNSEALISTEELDQVKLFYTSDWESSKLYAKS
jgi:hypothetical protein